MRFLYPEFLFALSAIAIPIIIHLFNFRKYRRVVFTNVRFLKEIKEETTSRSRLKHLLVLLTRILAIIFLVLAFAQPYIPDESNSINTASNSISIYVDNSFSMEALSKEGSLFDEARRKAREVVMAYSPNDKFQLLSNDFEGRHQRFVSRDEFIGLLDELTVTPARKTLAEVLSRQKDAFYGQSGVNKIAYVLSDFQKNNVDAITVKALDEIKTRLLPLYPGSTPNVFIDSVWFESPVHMASAEEHLLIRVENRSEVEIENVPVRLIINGDQKALASITMGPNSMKVDTIKYRQDGTGWQQAEVVIPDHPVSFDDKYYFSYFVANKMKVLAINGNGENEYISALYKSDPYFDLYNTNEQQLDFSLLKSYRFVIVNGLQSVSSGLAGELKRFVANGGHLLLFPGVNIDLNSYRDLLESIGVDIYTGFVSKKAKVAQINLQQDVFKDVFEEIPSNMNLPELNGFYGLSSSTRSSREMIMKLDNGQSFMSRYNFEQGAVYVCATPLMSEYTNLPKHALFLPLMYKITLLSTPGYPLAYTIGKDQVLEVSELKLSGDQAPSLRAKDFEMIPDMRRMGPKTNLYVADQVKNAGSYELIAGKQTEALFSFNYDRKESELEYDNPAELEEKLSVFSVAIIADNNKPLKAIITEINYGLRLWKLCIILTLLFLAAEILLLRFWNQRPSSIKTA